MFKVLDLFAGIGGTTLGIISYLESYGSEPFDYEYIAIENDPEVIEAREKLFNIYEGHTLYIINTDAYTFLNTTSSKEYDFIWASPPCQSHSRLNMFYNRKNPDMRLWSLITRLQQQQIPFIVENVEPYYREPIQHTLELGRHRFWSNKPLLPFEVPERQKDWGWMGIPDWEEYHGIESRVTSHIKDRMKRRQVLRNMTHYSISYSIIKQILNPKQKQLEVFT